MDGQFEVMKLQFLEDSVSDDSETTEEPVYIEYHYEYDYLAGTEKAYLPYGMKMDMGTKARGGYMLVWGTDYENGPGSRASVMRMALDGGTVDWSYVFEIATTISDLTQKDGEDIAHGCGYDSSDSTVFRLDTNKGSINWISQIGSLADTDRCRGIISWYDEKTRDDLLVVLIETNAGASFGGEDTPSAVKDAFLLTLDMSGDVIKSNQLSLYSADMTISDGSLVKWGNSIFFAGLSIGFSTKLQTATFDNSMSNGLVFKYQFDHPNTYNCIYEWDGSAGDISKNYKSGVSSSDYSKTNAMTMEKKHDMFIAYQSPYSGGFELKDSFSIPRPCASISINMTEVSYYYGQRKYDFDLTEQPGAMSAFAKMEQPLFTHQNGSEVGDWLATMDMENSMVYVQTDDQNFVDTHRTWIEGCSAGSDLLMANLYIDVLDNSAPSFVGGLQTTYRMNEGDKRTGKIPYYEDDEEHGVIAYLNAVPGFEFPDFVKFDNDTETYVIYPDSDAYNGKTYRFNVVL